MMQRAAGGHTLKPTTRRYDPDPEQPEPLPGITSGPPPKPWGLHEPDRPNRFLPEPRRVLGGPPDMPFHLRLGRMRGPGEDAMDPRMVSPSINPNDYRMERYDESPPEARRGGFVRRADGGYAPAAGSDPYASGSPIQSADVADPSSQQMLQRFSGMPYEQLQETVLRIGPASKMGQLANRVLQQKRAMPAPQQAARPGIGLPRPQQPATPQQDTSLQPGLGAITSALKQGFGKEQPEEPQADQGSVGYAGGGMTTKHPPWTRSGQTMMRMSGGAPTAGFLRSKVPGRTDALHGTPAANSYVIPADVISGLGEGNSLAGAHAMSMALSTGPGGIPLSHGGGGHGVRAPHMARGGAAEKVDVHLAGGEYIITPGVVAQIGGGDMKHGHAILDAFVKHVRSKTIKQMQKLPGPVKS